MQYAQDPQAANLGAPLGEYRSGGARIFYGVGAVGFIGLAVFMFTLVFTASGGDTGSAAIIGIIGLLILALGGYMLWLVIRSVGARVQLFEQGFTTTTLGRATTARWSDVASIKQAITRIRVNLIPVWTSYQYKVTLASGERLTFTETYGKVSKLGESLQRQITAVLLPKAMESLRMGSPVSFGPLSVSQTGISKGSDTLPWSEISGVTLNAGVVVIGRKGKRMAWARVSAAKVPNMFVLLSLVNRMRGAQ